MTAREFDALRRWRRRLEADDRFTVAERGAQAARDLLNADKAAVLLADERHRALQPIGADADAVPRDDGDHPAWCAFERGESVAAADGGVFDGPERAFPVGDYGVMVVGEFGDDAALARLLADELRSALERATWTRSPATRGPTSAETESASLSRLVDLVESVGAALARSLSSEELVRVFCERLAAVDGHVLAWYGDYRPGREAVTPEVWAGIEGDYLRDLEFSTDGAFGDAVETVLSTREVATVSRVADESGRAARRARERGLRSLALVPVVHGDTLYGIAAVYADRPDEFASYARAVLAGLGVAVGAALSAAESRRALVTDGVVELEFRLGDTGMVVVWLSERADCTLELSGLFLERDDTLRLFLAASGTTVEQLEAAAADHPEIVGVTGVADRDDEQLVEVTLAESSLAEQLAELGAVLRSVRVESGSGRATVELSASSEVRTFVERVLSAYPDTELLARRERVGQLQTPHEYRSILEERLTDRQHEALQTAYYGGFFEWPRDATGKDVAAALGVAQPTFLQHLRTAERKLLAAFFDEERFVYSRS